MLLVNRITRGLQRSLRHNAIVRKQRTLHNNEILMIVSSKDARALQRNGNTASLAVLLATRSWEPLPPTWALRIKRRHKPRIENNGNNGIENNGDNGIELEIIAFLYFRRGISPLLTIFIC